MIGKRNGRYDIVEYSELPTEQACLHDYNTGSLVFNHGHILVFLCRSDFLIGLITKGSQAQSNALYHKAFKKIEHCDAETWETVVPSEENGWKFELFLHNFMPMVEAGKLGILEVDR